MHHRRLHRVLAGCPTSPATETFTYTISDGNGGTDTATVTVTVTNSNDPPVAQDDGFTVAEDSINNVLTVKLDNGNGIDDDVDGDPLSVTAVGATDNGGSVSINDNGTGGDTTDDFIEYSPAADFAGTETFTYTISDGNGGTDTATVTVTVTNSNDPPVAQDDGFTVAEDSINNVLTVKLDNVNGIDDDVDGDPLSVTAVPEPRGQRRLGLDQRQRNGRPTRPTTSSSTRRLPDFAGTETFGYTIDGR